MGLSNAEISRALGVSAPTVKTHVTSIMRKMAVNDRTQAVIEALRRGWLDGEDPPAGVPARPYGPRPSPSGHHAVPPGADERVK